MADPTPPPFKDSMQRVVFISGYDRRGTLLIASVRYTVEEMMQAEAEGRPLTFLIERIDQAVRTIVNADGTVGAIRGPFKEPAIEPAESRGTDAADHTTDGTATRRAG